jgi:hypothetical protein
MNYFTNYNCQMRLYVIGQWSMRLPVLFTSVIGYCGAHAMKDLQCFLPFFVSHQPSVLILKFIFW